MPAGLSSLLGFDAPDAVYDRSGVLARIAVAMRVAAALEVPPLELGSLAASAPCYEA